MCVSRRVERIRGKVGAGLGIIKLFVESRVAMDGDEFVWPLIIHNGLHHSLVSGGNGG